MTSTRVVSPLVLSLCLGACGDDTGVTPQGSSTGSSGAGSSGAGPSTGMADDDTSGGGPGTTGSEESTGDTGFEPPVPMCGNGFVEADEECDDGNEVDDDGCTNVCRVPCGPQWSVLTLGPTLDSEIEGLAITRDADDQIVVAGRLREITVRMDGTEIVGDDTVLVQSYDPMGGFVWEQVLGSTEGDAFSAGVAVDGGGDVYVGATLDAADGGTAIQVIKLSGADGMIQWIHDFDGPFPGEDERAFGVAVGPDGQPVVSGQVRAGDGDDDVWVRKLEAADGTEVWTETYSGAGSGGFSTDDGGPIAIAADGSIYVSSVIYEDFQTQRGRLLRFGPDGGPPTWTFVPDIDGSDQSFDLGPLAVADDGGPLMSVLRTGGAGLEFWIYRLDAAGQEQWVRTRADFEVEDAGTDWILEGLAQSGDETVVLGRYVNNVELKGSSWWEVWVARLSADASLRCQALHQADSDGLIPPSLRAYAVATAADGSAISTGEQTSPEEASLWLGSYRP